MQFTNLSASRITASTMNEGGTEDNVKAFVDEWRYHPGIQLKILSETMQKPQSKGKGNPVTGPGGPIG